MVSLFGDYFVAVPVLSYKQIFEGVRIASLAREEPVRIDRAVTRDGHVEEGPEMVLKPSVWPVGAAGSENPRTMFGRVMNISPDHQVSKPALAPRLRNESSL
jgi:hypothetical protein